MLSVHTCPLATLGGKETGGMNVYVRDLCRELARQGHELIELPGLDVVQVAPIAARKAQVAQAGGRSQWLHLRVQESPGAVVATQNPGTDRAQAAAGIHKDGIGGQHRGGWRCGRS